MMNVKYFDHAATTPVDSRVLNEMLPFFNENFGNPSSIYSIGKKSKEAISISRMKIASSINSKVNEIYFTNGGSESDNLAIKGIAFANKNKGNHIITSKIEHPAVLNTCKFLERFGFEVTYINVDNNGFVDLKELEESITRKTILISIMFANNEIGTIQPIREIAKIAKKYGIYFHTDAVQAIGNIKIDVRDLKIDALSMSAHKFYGPKGMGAVYIKDTVPFMRIIDGGHQEKDKRAGTENVAGIVGMGKAIELIQTNMEENNERIKFLRDYFIQNIENTIPYMIVNGDRQNRLPGNANIAFKGVDRNKLLQELDNVGICASSGSACSAGRLTASHVLTEIKVPKVFEKGSLRVTLGKDNTKEEVDYLIDNLIEIVKKIR
ncbi:MAG: cysteine desulfurase NifS [Candidatus Scatovivens sp.]